MRLFLLPSGLLGFFLSACASRQAVVATAGTNYALDGEVERAQATMALDPQSTGGTSLAYVTLRPGSSHATAGYVEAQYEASLTESPARYRLTDLTYTYALASDTSRRYVLHFRLEARGTLRQPSPGRYVGTFAGRYDQRTPGLLAEVFTLRGQFAYAGPVTNLRESLGVPLPK